MHPAPAQERCSVQASRPAPKGAKFLYSVPKPTYWDQKINIVIAHVSSALQSLQTLHLHKCHRPPQQKVFLPLPELGKLRLRGVR